MPRRVPSESGYYHVTNRSAGQVALFEDDEDRRFYLRLVKAACDEVPVRIIAWVLMTDHVHFVVDVGSEPARISAFMNYIDSRYSRYFNEKTGRSGTLFQGRFWSKPIADDVQLIATVHYVHMNPEAAHIGTMRSYRWSSYQEYAGKKWVVDTSVILGIFGTFEAFDAYQGSQQDVVRKGSHSRGDEKALAAALEIAHVTASSELRTLAPAQRNEVIRELVGTGFPIRQIARVMGMGATSVTRIVRGA